MTVIIIDTEDHRILRLLRELHEKVDILMTEQTQIDADVTTIEQGVTALAAAATAIQAEIAALKQANPQADLSGLDKAAADLSGAVTSISALAPPPAPPAG